jgi:Ca-activated chloride channel family protein
LFLSSIALRSASKSAPAREYAIELARRSEAPVYRAVPTAPPPADTNTPAFPTILGGADERGLEGLDSVQPYDSAILAQKVPASPPLDDAGAQGRHDPATAAALPFVEPAKEAALFSAPAAKPPEVAFEVVPGSPGGAGGSSLALDESGRPVGGGAGGAFGQRARAARPRVSREGGEVAGPATAPSPPAEPQKSEGARGEKFTELAGAPETPGATDRRRLNEALFGVDPATREKDGAARWGSRVQKPLEDLQERKPGVDGAVAESSDTIHLLPQITEQHHAPANQPADVGQVVKQLDAVKETPDVAKYYKADVKREAERTVRDAEEAAAAEGVEMVTVEGKKADAVLSNDMDGDGIADVVGKDANRAQNLGTIEGFDRFEYNELSAGTGLVELPKARTVQGWAYSVDGLAGAKPGLPPPDPSAMEGLLRGYAHYRDLDQGLALDEFAARSLAIPAPIVGDEGLGQEGFRKRHGVNPFVDTRRDHFSTFGMDVDTASYTLARGALAAGKLPDPRHVRVEEFVNYFPEDLPASKDHVFSVRCEGGPSPFGEGLDLLKLTVKARDLLPGERKDAVLTFAVDTSGSMHEGDRLALVREALATLVRSLKPDDRVAVVGFSDNPYLVLPHTPAREADRILGAVASLTPRGDTNFEAGLALAYRVADEVLESKAVHRVILCSDGVATAGARGAEEILKRVEVFAKRGIYLSCVGFGMGKYNDRLLETLADKGNGNYAYADDLKAAADVFRRNLPATLQVLAQDAKVQVDFNPEVVSHYRLVGYENRDIADRDFRNDKVDAGEVGPGTTVTVLYEVLRRPGSSGDVGRVHVRYRDTGTGRVEEESHPLPPGVVVTRLAETSDRFRFIACAAETAELLRGSYWARNGSYGKVLGVLHGLGAEIRGRPEWKELAGLTARAQALTIHALRGK